VRGPAFETVPGSWPISDQLILNFRSSECVKIVYKEMYYRNGPLARLSLLLRISYGVATISKLLQVMMMIAFITFKSSLVPLFEGL